MVMPYINTNYKPETDSSTGLAIITVTGRCTDDLRATIEANCTRRYKMVLAPNAAGAVLKALDGTFPRIVEIRPPAMPGAVFRCVKVDGRVEPYAYRQTGGAYNGQFIHRFRMVYQQVGGVV